MNTLSNRRAWTDKQTDKQTNKHTEKTMYQVGSQKHSMNFDLLSASALKVGHDLDTESRSKFIRCFWVNLIHSFSQMLPNALSPLLRGQ